MKETGFQLTSDCSKWRNSIDSAQVMAEATLIRPPEGKPKMVSRPIISSRLPKAFSQPAKLKQKPYFSNLAIANEFKQTKVLLSPLKLSTVEQGKTTKALKKVKADIAHSLDTVSTLQKNVPTFLRPVVGVNNYRSILEVLKMCPPTAVLKGLTLVNKLWAKAASSDELWLTFSDDLYIPYDNSRDPKSTCAAYVRQQKTVVALCHTKVYYIDKTTWEFTSRDIPKIEEYYYSYVLLMDGSLLYCGGYRSVSLNGTRQCRDVTVRTVYIVTTEGKLTVQPDLITARRGHGAVAYGRRVFIFGGELDSMNPVLQNEMFDGSSWSPLPDLHASRVNFLPCIYRDLIYLCGGNNSSVEVLHTVSLSLRLLDVKTTPEIEMTVTAIYEDTLVLVTEYRISRWNFQEKSFQVTKIPLPLTTSRITRAVLHEGYLYNVAGSICPSLEILEMKTGKFL